MSGLPAGPEETDPEAWLGLVHVDDRKTIRRAARAALDGNLFELHAQRIVDVEAATGTAGALRAEAPIRLRDDAGELTPPGAFLPAADRFHLTTRIDRWVLARTLRLLSALPSTSVQGFPLHGPEPLEGLLAERRSLARDAER